MSKKKILSFTRLISNNEQNSKAFYSTFKFKSGGSLFSVKKINNKTVSLNSVQSEVNLNVVRCASSASKWAGPITKDNVLSSPYGKVHIPDKSITEYIFEHHKKFVDKPAITCGSTGRTYSYGLCRLMIDKLAMAMLSIIGIKHQSTVALVLPNIPEFVVCVNAALEAGLQVTLANPLYTEEELIRQFQDCDVKAIVTVMPLLEKCLAVKNKLRDYKGTILIGQDELELNGIFGFKPLMTDVFKTPLPSINVDGVALIPYSSGTTGLPKGVMLSHKNLVVNLMQLVNSTFCKPNQEYAEHYPMPDIPNTEFQRTKDGQFCLPGNHDTILTVPPFFHIYGFNGILNFNLRIGSHIVSIPRFTPEEYLACLRNYKPKSLFVVPSLLAMLASHPMVTKEDLDSVNHIVVGAAPVTDAILDKFLKKCEKTKHQIILQQGYGMTESSPVSTLTPYDGPHDKTVSVGQLVPGTEARIVSLKDGKNLPSNSRGELYVRGPQVMQGYYRNPKATADTVDEEKWLHTGDVGYYDDEHFFYIVDRTKELIKVRGNQVSPTELESVIMAIPSVADAAVIGISDDASGELPKAFIVLKDDSNLTTEEIYDFVKEKVVKYKRLDGGVVLIDSIPRNLTGKILRKELKEMNDQKSS